MVIGGQAVLVHGEPRLTEDIDITLGVDIARVNDIIVLLKTPALDMDYMRNWLEQFSEIMDQPLISQFEKIISEICDS